MHSDDMLFIQPFFFNLFSPANFTADLAIHIAVLPVVIAALILGHIVLVRIQGLNPPLPAKTSAARTAEVPVAAAVIAQKED
jgi:quinol-cytochrome oxidoreductase complex cytochrome b subunit